MSETVGGFERRLRELGAGGLSRALGRYGIRLALKGEAAAKMNATTRLRVRSGRLRNSIAGTVEPTANGIAVVLSAGGRSGGSPVRYARIQEEGGTITPTRGRFLVFSVDPAAHTPAGVPRLPTPSGSLIFARSVTIPAKHYMRDALHQVVEPVPADLRALVSSSVRHG